MATLSSFYNDIKRGEYKPLYLLCGSAELLISEAVDYLITEFNKKSPSAINIRQVDAEEVDSSDVVEEACTPPFFSDRRLLIVKNTDKWPPSAQRKLLPLLKNPPDFTILVLVGESSGKLRTIYSAAQKKGSVVSINVPKDRDLIEWIRNRTRVKGKNIIGPAAAHLLELVGKDLRELSNAIDKLISYVDEARTIEVKHVTEALDDIRTRSIFELTDAVGNRQIALALRALKRLMEAGESPLMVTNMLNRHFRNIWQAKVILQKVKSIQELADVTGTAPWLAKKFAAQSKHYTLPEIKHAFKMIYETDRTLKTTMVPEEDCLELLLIKICIRKNQATSPKNHKGVEHQFY